MLLNEARGHYNTVAELVRLVSGYLPVAEGKVESADWMFDIGLDNKRIGTVLAVLLCPSSRVNKPDSLVARQRRLHVCYVKDLHFFVGGR